MGRLKDGRAEHQPIWLTSKLENPNKASFLVLVDGREAMALNAFEKCLDLFEGDQMPLVALAKKRPKAV